MKPPGPFTYLIGNPLSAIILMLGAAYLGYEAVFGDGSPLLALVALVVAMMASAAFNRLEKYRLWKREWDALGGRPPRRFALPNLKGLRFVAGMIAWAFLAVMALAVANEPGMGPVVTLFWGMSIVMLIVGIFQLRKHRRSARPARGESVKVCLPVARSPSLRQAYDSLPDYCQALLERR